MTTQAIGANSGGLSDPEKRALTEDFIADALDVTTRIPNPSVVMLGGQPGAGKSVVKFQIAEGFANHGGIIAIDPDDIRPALPYMAPFLAKGGSDIPEHANKDAGEIAYMVLQGLKSEQRNILIDGTLRNTSYAQSTAKEFKNAGFNVEFHGMAVYPDLSHGRTYLRREKEIDQSASDFGRAVDDDFHQNAVTGYTDTVETFFEKKSVNRMVLYDRTAEVVLDIKLEGKIWTIDDTRRAASPTKVLHKAHTQPDAASLFEAAETWREATVMASSRTPVAPDVDKLATHQAAAQSKMEAAEIQVSPSTTYRGPIVAVNGDTILQAVGDDLVRHRLSSLTGPGKNTLASVGTDVKITYGVHTGSALIQAQGRTRNRRL